MTMMRNDAETVKPIPLILSLQATAAGRASWLSDKPIEAFLAVENGEATWLSDRPCCNAESEPCISCREDHPAEMSDSYRAEHAAALAREIMGGEFAPEPTDVCPRCNGLGVRQVIDSEGVITEDCSSCGGEGEVDAATADTIRRLMDLANSRADPEGWDDSARWVTTEPAHVEGASTCELPLPMKIAIEINRYRSTGTDFGTLIAERLEGLLSVVRALDATDVETYRDRRQAMLSGVMGY